MPRRSHFILVGVALAAHAYGRDESGEVADDACLALPRRLAELSGTRVVRAQATAVPTSMIQAMGNAGVAAKVRGQSDREASLAPGPAFPVDLGPPQTFTRITEAR